MSVNFLPLPSIVAIKELVAETKHSCRSSSSNGPQCELVFLDDDEDQKKEDQFKFVNGKTKKTTTQKHKSGNHVDLAREQSRAEARARARERTKEKVRIKNQQYELKKFPNEYSCHGVSSSNLKHQSSFWEDEVLVEDPIEIQADEQIDSHADDYLETNLNLEDGSSEIDSISVSKSEMAVNDLEIESSLPDTSVDSEHLHNLP
ncbi:hypothetical protein LXL04_004869 [Taraxacum kok-saghyz]